MVIIGPFKTPLLFYLHMYSLVYPWPTPLSLFSTRDKYSNIFKMCVSVCHILWIFFYVCIYFNLHKQHVKAHSTLFFFFTLSIICFRGPTHVAICILNLLTTAQYPMVCTLCFHILLPIHWNNYYSVYVLIHTPTWTSERLSLKYISSSGMAVLKLWNIHFDWLGLEKLHICVYSHKQGNEDSKCLPFTNAWYYSAFQLWVLYVQNDISLIFIFLLLLGLST